MLHVAFGVALSLCTPQPVTLQSPLPDPRVFVWPSRDYAPRYRRGVLSLPLIERDAQLVPPGTHAIVVMCASAALGIKLTSGALRGHYGWVDILDAR